MRTESHSLTSFEVARAIANLANDRKALDIVILNTEDVTPMSDYFVIATVDNRTQLQSLSQAISQYCSQQLGIKANGVERDLPNHWVLLDLGDIVVHLFNPESRVFYGLEQFWSHATKVPQSQWLDDQRMVS